jgi:hypothetical protein
MARLLAELDAGPPDRPGAYFGPQATHRGALHHAYGQWTAKLLACIHGGEPADHRSHPAVLGEQVCHFNLYPVPLPGTEPHHWTRPIVAPGHGPARSYQDVTGLPTKAIYRSWCRQERFPFFSTEARRHQPRVIVGTGTSYLDHFAAFFAGQSRLRDWREHDVRAPGPKGEEVRTAFSAEFADQATTLFVVPFFAKPRHGINSEALVLALGRLIGRHTGLLPSPR